MDNLKKAVLYCQQIRKNEIDHGDILVYQFIPVMGKLLLWWPEEDDKKKPSWVKICYNFLSISLAIAMFFGLLYLLFHIRSKPVPMVLQDLSISFAGFIGACGTIIFPFFRTRTSTLMRVINKLNLDVLNRSNNALDNRRSSNNIFISVFILFIVAEIIALVAFALFAWDSAITGLPQFNSFLYQTTPYSVMSFIVEAIFVIPGTWMMTVLAVYLTMHIEFILRISFFFRVIARDMQELRKGVDIDEEKEQQKLKSLIKDLNLLYWCVDENNEILRLFMIIYFFLSFTTLGVYIAVILALQSIQQSTIVFCILFYNTTLTVSLCVMGQHLKDSAVEVGFGIYDCNWYTAPIPFRKLVLNVLTRCTKDILFSANPVYDLDLLLLTRVLKATYTLIAVFGKATK